MTLPLMACSELPTGVADRVAADGSASVSPFDAARMYVDPASRASRQADAWRQSRPADAVVMDRLASQPLAAWFGDWNVDVRAAVAARVGAAAAAGALPVLVAYNIPLRDCGSHSAGGAASAAAYRSWIGALAQGLGGTRAVVILEPDALAGATCLTAAQQEERYGLLKYAVGILRAQGSAVYIDAGHPAWLSPETAAARLERAGIAEATGFALNVSNFQTTASNITYGSAISALVGGSHFVIDTSRNGAGPASGGEWCNPPGRAVGTGPTARTGHPLVDALLWVKVPGESDGVCNGGPPAGQWWPEYALGLAQRAGTQLLAYGG